MKIEFNLNVPRVPVLLIWRVLLVVFATLPAIMLVDLICWSYFDHTLSWIDWTEDDYHGPARIVVACAFAIAALAIWMNDLHKGSFD